MSQFLENCTNACSSDDSCKACLMVLCFVLFKPCGDSRQQQYPLNSSFWQNRSFLHCHSDAFFAHFSITVLASNSKPVCSRGTCCSSNDTPAQKNIQVCPKEGAETLLYKYGFICIRFKAVHDVSPGGARHNWTKVWPLIEMLPSVLSI
jgi:hypothetical protein